MERLLEKVWSSGKRQGWALGGTGPLPSTCTFMECPVPTLFCISFLGLLQQSLTSWVAYSNRSLFSPSLEARRLLSGYCRKGSGGRPSGSLPAPGVSRHPWHSLVCGWVTPVSASVCIWCSSLCLCVFPLLVRTTVMLD